MSLEAVEGKWFTVYSLRYLLDAKSTCNGMTDAIKSRDQVTERAIPISQDARYRHRLIVK